MILTSADSTVFAVNGPGPYRLPLVLPGQADKPVNQGTVGTMIP